MFSSNGTLLILSEGKQLFQLIGIKNEWNLCQISTSHKTDLTSRQISIKSGHWLHRDGHI